MTRINRSFLAAGLAALIVSVAAGCATTQGETATTGSSNSSSPVASNGQPLPQCIPGWNQCVCEKESRCCSVRKECSCTTGGTPGLASCV